MALKDISFYPGFSLNLIYLKLCVWNYNIWFKIWEILFKILNVMKIPKSMGKLRINEKFRKNWKIMIFHQQYWQIQNCVNFIL